MPNLYIIAGCNGAGKYTILPEILNCREFVNADNIAAGLSPFNADSVAFEAGRIMLNRIKELLASDSDFAIETTLATKSYTSLVLKAQRQGYRITLLYFWLNSPLIAVKRVEKRVLSGGHHIPAEVVFRRYYRGIQNLFKLYKPICDHWLIINNMNLKPEIIAKGSKNLDEIVLNDDIWNQIKALKSNG